MEKIQYTKPQTTVYHTLLNECILNEYSAKLNKSEGDSGYQGARDNSFFDEEENY
jgi:hypothetical protein